MSQPSDQGYLGADVAWDERVGAYLITHVVVGDCWHDTRGGPLSKVGMDVRVGDYIVAVNGQRLDQVSGARRAARDKRR